VSGNTERLNAALASRYRIEKQLGQGGMATVYLAHDLKHDRKVAVKVLKPELAAVLGAERFVVEIKTTASLQHPHILPLFDSGVADSFLYYVMPYIEGETLRGKLNRETQIGVDEAVRITTQVADALDYAHRHGVIHRDIKPENILLHDGRPMVADFGIALAVSAAAGGRMTETGLSLGTPHYMSPEQATAEKEITGRSDIYSLASVLFEMLAGQPPHMGGSAQQIIMKIITETAGPVTKLRKAVPPNVSAALEKALEKLPADRFETAKQFGDALTDRAFTTTAAAGAMVSGLGSRVLSLPFAVAASIAALSTIVAVWLALKPAPTAVTPSRLALVERGMEPVFSGVARTIAITKDGQTIAYGASHPLGTRVVVRKLDGTSVSVIQNSATTFHLRFSPDGRMLYAGQGGRMLRIGIAGGTWSPLQGMEGTSYMDFAPDGAIWWASMVSLKSYRRGPDGRDSLVILPNTIEQFLPDGRHALALGPTTGSNTSVARWVDIRTGAATDIFDTPIVEHRFTMGYLVYVRPDGVMIAAPFDATRGVVTGTQVEIATNVSVNGFGLAQFAVSENGTVAYVPGSNNDLVRVSRDGAQRVLIGDQRRYHSPRISPDSRHIAFDDVTAEGRDVWLYTEGIKGLTRTTFQRDAHDPSWTLDGKGLFYIAGHGGRLDIYRTQLGSTVPPKPLGTKGDLGYTGTPMADGRMLSMMSPASGRGLDIVIVAPDSVVENVLADPADESYVVPSPNGRWYAYTSDHSGRPEVYVRAIKGSDVQIQVSLEGASEPMWSRDGRELFYRRATPAGSELVAAAMELGADARVLKRTSLFDASNFDASSPHSNYDVSPDGSWFVFARRAGSDHIVVIQNLPELARRLARTGAVQ
jgi:tRNA A-37 threonylcarbamoyl transferase component Bud32